MSPGMSSVSDDADPVIVIFYNTDAEKIKAALRLESCPSELRVNSCKCNTFRVLKREAISGNHLSTKLDKNHLTQFKFHHECLDWLWT